MSYTLADAIRGQFERDHPRGRNTLKCTSCYQRKDREEFREQPWHGRAACCKRCEGFRWSDIAHLQTLWELQQTREKLRAVQRIAAVRKFRLLLTPTVRSADALRAYEQPYYDALERAHRRLAPTIAVVVDEYERQRPKRRRLMNERTR